MALVSKVIGDCPACGRKDGYGNINVSGNQLLRGCLSCRHLDHIPLPNLKKKVLYLDQFFYSHAFRGRNAAFQRAKEKIQRLAHNQVLVAPYCNIHEDETHLWTPAQRDPLWKFIKQTSAGKHFRPEYEVKSRQLHRAFEAFLKGGPAEQQTEAKDALPSDLNQWDDYVWIDVGRFHLDPAIIRDGKKASTKELLDLFPVWAAALSTFEDDVHTELRGAANAYLQLYATYFRRIVEGDYDAIFDSPIDSQVVEALLRYGPDALCPLERMTRIRSFFVSEHYANVPVERISSQFFALLRQFLRAGAFRSREKSEKRFGGFFYDVRFISTYAPYCDAMVLDTLMHRWATDPRIDLPGRYGIKLFSRANWDAFLEYLDELEERITPELRQALSWVRPVNAKVPDWLR
jgi:hypothetical protein